MSSGADQDNSGLETHPGPKPQKGIADKYLKSADATFASMGLLDVAQGRFHRKALELVPIDLTDYISNEPPRSDPPWFRWA